MIREFYQHEANYNYLVIEGIREQYSSFSDKMIQENTVPGLLPCQFRFIDGKTYFYYKINSMQSIAQIFDRRKINYEELSKILSEMEKNWRDIENYLIDQEKILLSPEYIFTDFDLEKIYFCYYSDYEEKRNYEKLAAFLVDHIDYQDTGAVELAYGFHGQILEKNSSFTEIVRKLLTKKDTVPKNLDLKGQENCEIGWKDENDMVLEFRKEIEDETIQKNLEIKGNISVKFFITGIIILFLESLLFFGLGILEFYQKIMVMVISILVIAYLFWNQRKTEEKEVPNYEIKLDEKVFQKEKIESVGQTMVLSRLPEVEKKMLWYQGKDSLTDFELNVFPFVLGKAEKGIDGTIVSPLISRIHCQINYINEKYYIQDLNSTNGTYLNGRLLEPREQVQINSGDKITLANQLYTFQ